MLEIRALLWEWVAELLDEDDAEQRGWKEAYAGGLLDACEALGALPPEELERWRAIAAGGPLPAAAGDGAAAERHLEGLLAGLPALSRDPDPEGLRRWWRFDGALAALEAAGVLDADRSWRERALAAQAPWLEAGERAALAATDGPYAIGVPSRSPEEAAEDAAAEAAFEAAARHGRARGVFVAGRVERHDGLAVVAVVTRTESTEVHFHHVGGPEAGGRGGARMEAYRRAMEALPAPELADDAGTAYTPAVPLPVTSHGGGGIPGTGAPQVMTGAWRYQPPAPERATRFTVSAGAERWELI